MFFRPRPRLLARVRAARPAWPPASSKPARFRPPLLARRYFGFHSRAIRCASAIWAGGRPTRFARVGFAALFGLLGVVRTPKQTAPDLVWGRAFFEPAKAQFCLPGGVELSGNGHTPCVNLRLSRPLS